MLKEKMKYIPILYFNSLDYVYFVSLPFLTVPCQVGLQSAIVAFLLAIHIVHSLETNRAGPISSQILVLSEHNLFMLKEKRNYIPILYFNSLDYVYFVSLPFLTVPCQVGLQSVIFAFLSHTLSFLEL